MKRGNNKQVNKKEAESIKIKHIFNLVLLYNKKAKITGSIIMRCVLSVAMLLSNTAGYAYASGSGIKINLKI